MAPAGIVNGGRRLRRRAPPPPRRANDTTNRCFNQSARRADCVFPAPIRSDDEAGIFDLVDGVDCAGAITGSILEHEDNKMSPRAVQVDFDFFVGSVAAAAIGRRRPAGLRLRNVGNLGRISVGSRPTIGFRPVDNCRVLEPNKTDSFSDGSDKFSGPRLICTPSERRLNEIAVAAARPA